MPKKSSSYGGNFLCFMCGSYNCAVINTRSRTRDGTRRNYIIRRRKCLNCGTCQNTYESAEKPKIAKQPVKPTKKVLREQVEDLLDLVNEM